MLWCAIAFSQQRTLAAGSWKADFSETDGRIDGSYCSYYPNGVKKAEGQFERNMRAGRWSVWDSTGKLVMRREYENPFVYRQLYPKVRTDATIRLLNVPQYDLARNEQGFMPYFFVQERMVVWSKRIWQTISMAENPVLFENDRLFDLVYTGCASRKLKLYNQKWDTVSAPVDTTGLRCIAFRIMEDHFFDNERLLSEARILSIEPLLVNAANDTVPFGGRCYFPHLRSLLAQEQVKFPENADVQTFDDLFFFRDFSAQAYKESSLFGRQVRETPSGEEADHIAIGLIEQEHDLWLELFAK